MNEARLTSFMKKLPKDIIDEYNAATAQAAAEKQAAAAAAGKSSASGSGSGSNGRGWRPWVTAAAVLATVAIFFVAGVLISIKLRAGKQKASVSATDDLTSQSATPTAMPADNTDLPNDPTDAAATPDATSSTDPTATPDATAPAEDALLTLEYIRSTEPYKCFSWSETYSEQAGGFLSADGVPLDFAALLTEAPLVDGIDPARPEKFRFVVAGTGAAIRRISIYTTSGDYIYTLHIQGKTDQVSAAENALLTRDITANAAVIPDECFVVVEVSKAGTYYPEFDRSESFGWNCVFRFRYAGGASSATADPPTTTPESIPTPTVAPTATATPTSAPTKTPTSTPTSAPTPTIDPDQILIKRIEPILQKGTIEVGETMMLDFMALPFEYTYGTVRWRFAEDNGCATLDAVTGALTGVKPGVVRVIAYCVEYEVQLTPVNIVIKEASPLLPEPEHEVPLDAKYRPDTLSEGGVWTRSLLSTRAQFLVYNGQTPDELPVYIPYSTPLHVSPYSNDLTIYVQLMDYGEKYEKNPIFANKGVKVKFYEPSGKLVGYSYTNSAGIAMFTIKAQSSVEFRVEVEGEYLTSDFVTSYGETVNHISFPGGNEYTRIDNSGRAAMYTAYAVDVYSYLRFDIKVIDQSTGNELNSGILRFYDSGWDGPVEFDHYDLSMEFWRNEDFWDSAQGRIILEYYVGSELRTAQCYFGGHDEADFSKVTLYADISS